MRSALLSGIHGNLTALDAVLADARALGVDIVRGFETSGERLHPWCFRELA